MHFVAVERMVKMSDSNTRHHDAVTGEVEDPMNEEVTFMSDEEFEAYIGRLEQELGMSRAEFLEQVKAGTEPDTFAAMALKALLLY